MIDLVDGLLWPKLLYATCFVHSTVRCCHVCATGCSWRVQLIERKRFGPIGWCVPYEFNHTDLVASSLFLENYLYSVWSSLLCGL
jgi:dynein heavy chain